MNTQILPFESPATGPTARSAEAPGAGDFAKGLYVPVTRKVIPMGGKKQLETEQPVPNILFIDWLTISQVHHGKTVPVVNDGSVISIDADGEIQFLIDRRLSVRGSFDSQMQIRSDGIQTEFSGNICRFNRRDNLFGYSLSETIQKINELMESQGLPPFTRGEKMRFADSGEVWTGARVSRIDLTLNMAAYSISDARAVMKFLSFQHMGRQKHQLTPDGATLSIGGTGSRYVYHKIYLKHQELLAHSKKRTGQHVGEDVINFTRDMGILREELTLKSRFLTQNGLAWLGAITRQRLSDIFFHRSMFSRLKQIEYEDNSQMPHYLLPTYHAWLDGRSMIEELKKTKFYRHRRELLAYGVDISIANNVERLPLKVRSVDLAAVVAPDWYREKYG